MGLDSVTAALPPKRGAGKALVRLGFRPGGEVEISGERFLRFRLDAEAYREREGGAGY